MIQTTARITFAFILLICFLGEAQVISSKVIDSISKEPIPYVTVQLNKGGVITNEEGRFSFLLGNNVKPTDSLIISCMGFKTLIKPLNQFTDSVIYLIPRAIELKSVIVSNKVFTAEEIIEKVKENIEKNYDFDLTKKRLFFRQSEHQNFSKMDYKLKKSSIEALHKSFLDSVMASVPKNNSFYTEVLCDFYGGFDKGTQKIDLIKASELYDKNNEVGFTALEDKFNQIIENNVKPDSYFKIKSGWFGQKLEMEDFKKEEIDSTDTETLKKELEAKKKREEDRKTNFAKYRRNRISGLLEGLFFQEDTKQNFIRKSGRYEFKMLDFTYLGEDAVYVSEFVPKGGADYKGTLYINAEDFAIIRADYENVKAIKNFKLLGISYRIYKSKGKMIFGKGKNNHYSLQYLEKENGSRFGIRRPLKIVEKNKNVKGRRKQNELSLDLDMAISSVEKYEIVVFGTEDLTQPEFDGFKENNKMLPTYMPAYDPEFWKG